MIRYETKEVIQEVAVAKVCDACGIEGLNASNWRPGHTEDLRLISFVDSWDGESTSQQMDLCPSCFNKVVLYAQSIGGKLYDLP